MARHVPSSRRTALRRLALRVACAMASLAMLVGLVSQGRRYFYCPLMASVSATSCCESARAPASSEPAVERADADCCELESMATLPSASLAVAPEALAAPLVAVVAHPTLAHALPPSCEHASRTARLGRFGGPSGPPKAPSVVRAQLMVFVI